MAMVGKKRRVMEIEEDDHRSLLNFVPSTFPVERLTTAPILYPPSAVSVFWLFLVCLWLLPISSSSKLSSSFASPFCTST